jgi:hypothetical protein
MIMGKPLGYTPPCLCCRTSDDNGPHFDRRWKVTLKEDYDGSTDLSQPHATGPCAWVHRSCLMEFMLHTATKRTEGKAEPSKVCLVCETRIPDEVLWPLVWHGQKNPPAIWVHPDCLREYQQ